MKIAIILNGISLEKNHFYKTVLPALQESFHVEVFETRSRNDAVALSSKAVDKKFNVIMAVGGDGTTHQVVNGVLEGRELYRDLPTLAVFPLGTGNDFARSLNVVRDINQLIFLLKNFTPQKQDVGIVEYTNDNGTVDQRYFINVADVGMGPEVVRRVLDSDRILGSAVSYYLAILTTFIRYKPVQVLVTTPDWKWEGKLRTLAVANGKYYGHGLCIAPDAKTDDTIFETFICGNASVLDFIKYSNAMKKGEHISHPHVMYKWANELRIQSELPCAVEADGEWLGWLPAKIEMTPIKLSFLCPK
jgi:diacylglycerol kinase (ATP)